MAMRASAPNQVIAPSEAKGLTPERPLVRDAEAGHPFSQSATRKSPSAKPGWGGLTSFQGMPARAISGCGRPGRLLFAAQRFGGEADGLRSDRKPHETARRPRTRLPLRLRSNALIARRPIDAAEAGLRDAAPNSRAATLSEKAAPFRSRSCAGTGANLSDGMSAARKSRPAPRPAAWASSRASRLAGQAPSSRPAPISMSANRCRAASSRPCRAARRHVFQGGRNGPRKTLPGLPSPPHHGAGRAREDGST